jgi:hypothetical protein
VREVEKTFQSHQKPTTKMISLLNLTISGMDWTQPQLHPCFLHKQKNDFQKPIKFVSTSRNVFFGKESEKASEEKPVEKPSGEKPSEHPKPKPKPKLVRFHCGYCGRGGRKNEFFFKRKREERMAKEWANKDKYHPSDGVLEPRVQIPRAKVSVRTIPAWGERKAVGGATGRDTLVRPVMTPVRPMQP